MYMKKESAKPPECFKMVNGFRFRNLEALHRIGKVHILSRGGHNAKERVYLRPGETGTAGVVSIRSDKARSLSCSDICWVKVGFDNNFRPRIFIAKRRETPTTRVIMPDLDEFEDAQASINKPSDEAYLFANDWLTDDVLRKGAPPKSHTHWLYGFLVWAPRKLPKANHARAYDLEVINLRIRLSLLPETRTVHTTGPTQWERYIWTVDFLEVAASPETEAEARFSVLSWGAAIGVIGSVIAATRYLKWKHGG